MESYEWSKRIDKYRKVLCSYADGKVLELGVGTGQNWKFYHAGCQVTGIDWSPEMLQKCKEKDKWKVTAVSLVEADARELPFPDESFDTVVSTFLLCSTADQSQVLKEALRVTKKGGKLLILEYGKPSSFLTKVHLDLYRFTYIFKYGYDQCSHIHKYIEDLPVTINVFERKQGGQIYFYILSK